MTLADLDDDGLRALIGHGEDDLVERKRQPPAAPKFGATVASFANTLGGWVLLGVDDDGRVRGWQVEPPKTDLQSHLANVLRHEVDPLPPFVVDYREYDGKRIAVMRVFESSDVPHIERGTGAIYVRTSAGKVPVESHRRHRTRPARARGGAGRSSSADLLVDRSIGAHSTGR
jgi:predicted HTH transcriptional regulator